MKTGILFLETSKMAREARRQGSMPAGKKARRKGGNETRRQRGTLFGGMEATRHSRRQDGKQAGKAASKEARRQGSKEAGRQRGSEKTRQGGNLFGGKVARSQPRNVQRRQVSQKQRSKEAIEEARRQARRQSWSWRVSVCQHEMHTAALAAPACAG